MVKFAPRVKETTTTTGTGSYTVDGAASGFQSFDDAFSSSDTVSFYVTDGTDWEHCHGVFTSPSTLARTSVEASSNSGSAVNWGAGTKTVFCGISAGNLDKIPDETPVVDSSATADAINEGSPVAYTATATGSPSVHWRIYDDGGITGLTIGYDSGEVSGGVAASPGSYTFKVQCANAFGISEPFSVSITINAFTLSRDTMFGEATSAAHIYDEDSTSYDFSEVHEGAVIYDSSSYYIDRSNTYDANATDHLLFYDPSNEILRGFRKDSIGTWTVRTWTSVTDITDGAEPGGGSTPYITNSSQISDLRTVQMHGKYWPILDRQWWADGQFYLEITPSGGVLDDFLTKKTSHQWSYGFTLHDDWMGGTGAMQMLQPLTHANGFHNFGLALFTIGTTYYDYVAYGDYDSGPYSSSSGPSITEDTSCIARAGDRIAVRWDGSTMRVYKNATAIFSSSSYPGTYMQNIDTTDPVIGFGYNGLTNESNPTDEDHPTGWIPRIKELWIANSSAISAADLTEMDAHSEDYENSDNYSDIDVYCEFTASAATVTKGTVTLARQSQ